MNRSDLLNSPIDSQSTPAGPRDNATVMTNTEPAGWHFAGVWPGGQPFRIDGVDVWTLPWRAENVPQVQTRDPAYGNVWRLPVYSIEMGGRRTAFLATEVSNGMWAFYTARPSAGRGVRVPPLPAAVADTAASRSPVLRTLAAFVPLAAALFSVPWTVFVAMAHMGGPGPAAQDPQWRVWFMGEILLPSALGLLTGLVLLGPVRPRGAVAWAAWGLGMVACVAVFATLCVIG